MNCPNCQYSIESETVCPGCGKPIEKSYADFIQDKQIKFKSYGVDVDPGKLHPSLFQFQKDSVLWMLRKGRALGGLDTGLGKTRIQLEWARILIELGKAKHGLIIAPLSVAKQTLREASKIDIDLKYIRESQDLDDTHSLYITNYEMAHNFNPSDFGEVALDESSILKSLDGKYRRYLTKAYSTIPFRSCYTATPAPNDEVEIGNHAEYLGVNTANEMKSMFFINANKVSEDFAELADGRTVAIRKKHSNKEGQEWRLRNYGKEKFYEWLASWALMMSLPSDLGYSDNGYVLPALNIHPLFVDVDYVPEGQLFFTKLKGIQDRTKIRRGTLNDRVNLVADLTNSDNDQWIHWCALDIESQALKKVIKDCVEIKGSDSPEYKAEMMEAFQDGKYKVMITKPRIAGFGMNFQNAHKMAFVGLGDSWELYYQCLRREWRFGQKFNVEAYIILSEIEHAIYDNVMRKERMATEMKKELMKNVRMYEEQELGIKQVLQSAYQPQKEMLVPSWLR